MPFHGSVVVIKRSGEDGSVFPLVTESCLLGSNKNCDIRVQLPAIAGEHCKISVNENKQVRISPCSIIHLSSLQDNGQLCKRNILCICICS